MVTPGAKREAVSHACKEHGMSEPKGPNGGVQALQVDRATVRYQSIRPDDSGQRTAMKAVAAERRRFGYRRIHVMLQRQGIQRTLT